MRWVQVRGGVAVGGLAKRLPWKRAIVLSACLLFVACATSTAPPEALIPESPALSAEDYRIGPDDLLKIDVFQVAELSRQVRVNSRGEVSLPLIGKVRVAGLTGQELEALLAHRLSERYLVDPQVHVFIEEFISQRVTVEGRVKKPGVYPLKGPTTLLQVIAMSEGIEELADTERIQLFRAGAGGKKQAYFFDIEAIRKGEARDPGIKADDIIIVHEDGGKAFTHGVAETLRGIIHIGGTVPLF